MNADEKTRPCPSCDGVMRRGVRDETVTFQDEALTYEQPGWHCGACDDGILEGEDNAVNDAALHEVMARAKHSPISPLMVRAARDAVGVSQREAGRVFGGGPTAFYKYETAKAVPSEGMANLLRVAIEQPGLFRRRPRGAFSRLSGVEAELLRKTIRDDRLASIFGRVYPAKERQSEQR
ncbi:MAG: type II toxin-antitoxin system MqsA family antitoxin [Caulobacteraceae bacterium]